MRHHCLQRTIPRRNEEVCRRVLGKGLQGETQGREFMQNMDLNFRRAGQLFGEGVAFAVAAARGSVDQNSHPDVQT